MTPEEAGFRAAVSTAFAFEVNEIGPKRRRGRLEPLLSSLRLSSSDFENVVFIFVFSLEISCYFLNANCR